MGPLPNGSGLFTCLNKEFIMYFFKTALLGASAALFATSAFAQVSDSETVTATATILSPINLTKTNNMSFGSIVSDEDGGTIDSETGMASDGVTLVGTPNSATFTVTGQAGETFGINIPSNVILDGSGSAAGAPSMPAALSLVSGTSTGNVLPDADGFKVKGVLTVAGSATQLAGPYSGEFLVDVAYE